MGVVALTLAALGACTGGGADHSPVTDSKSAAVDGATASPLPPGKYQTLPQPCSAVDADALKKLVPGATDYAGKESLTYDTDRRVGCMWQAATAQGVSHKLSIDVERVVSYDPAISDEEQAQKDFDQRAAAASIQLTPTGTPSGTTSPPAVGGTSADTLSGASTGPGAGSGSSSDGSSTGTGSDGSNPDVRPRELPNIGDAAFINDVLHAPASPATTASGPSRDVTLVFRTANVVVSITYVQSSPRGGDDPDSADLQKGAQQVAGQLESRIEH
ncbi:hypothetical protein GA0115240_128519 [Streptomyces sp. DvalAA-14]|uniref:DUF3558 domain-containing protein n=1 Tax=unclassified Streptomyces TaxID=2593676 RepID=UPI00081BA51C|nr:MULTISPECIES: DUF3558 domain-containing protein [unclassified Streptomyces]MYS21275.1 hypothetical protein [Streptomyces sp. SID4948]SCD88583.1 hypothetical protein GA0115240_128519 [Streptomyces sp. DvalAA-14]